ncbi:hypothetical protein Sulac_0665 [Sulfobacillus acidophilus DSM 10332]|uniref:Uncharacterized protein n=1 Tax=Sulfobacillus acidophilus (strain ATCC 700253 / DSM 10332 / NAL) TaxID=679936 RepID=G8U006_SULAD|nr:hypothetical protein Sulac_0665 [Sulfobacillus acidophilus DSM 10332]
MVQPSVSRPAAGRTSAAFYIWRAACTASELPGDDGILHHPADGRVGPRPLR